MEVTPFLPSSYNGEKIIRVCASCSQEFALEKQYGLLFPETIYCHACSYAMAWDEEIKQLGLDLRPAWMVFTQEELQSPALRQKKLELEGVTPSIPEDYAGEITTVVCHDCRKEFSVQTDYYEAHHPIYCHSCSFVRVGDEFTEQTRKLMAEVKQYEQNFRQLPDLIKRLHLLNEHYRDKPQEPKPPRSSIFLITCAKCGKEIGKTRRLGKANVYCLDCDPSN